MAYAWVVTPQKVQTVIHKIVEVSQPQKVILFGSYVNGDIGINSDLDVLVVTGNHIENPRKESIRIPSCPARYQDAHGHPGCS